MCLPANSLVESTSGSYLVSVSPEKFLATQPFQKHVCEPPPVYRDLWEFDPKEPEQSLKGLKELRKIAFFVTESGFRSPPSLWHGCTPRKPWGLRLMNGDWESWKRVQRQSGKIDAAIFYPTEMARKHDFMLCVNRYVPLALTRIQDADVRGNKNKLDSICKSVGLQFEHPTDKPILFPREPRNCDLEDVRVFIDQLDRFKNQVGCSARELGEFFRFG